MRHIRPLLIATLLVATIATTAQGQTRGGFDGQGRLLMHGTPRFMLGVYDSGGAYSSDPAHWEQQIFSPTGSRGLQGFPLNVYLNYWLGNMPIGPTNALLDVLQNHGMMYLQTGNCFDTGSWTRYGPGSFSIMSQTYVQQYAQHPAALGYYIMDECVDALIPETEAHHQQLKAWDPQGLTFAANLAAGYRDPSLWINAADIMGTDPYPLYGAEPAAGYTHFIVADFVSKLRAVAKPDRPVWSVLQFFKFTTNSRMPTPDELRAHAVMSIVEGAQGIFWWDIGVNGLRRLDAATVSTYMSHLKALTTELAGLEPALLADPAPGGLVGNSTRFADPVAGRIAQLQHNIAVEWLFSRKQWYQEELAALQAGNTSKSGGLLTGAANVRTLTKVVDGVGYVFAYNYTNSPKPVTFTWHQTPTGVRESKTGETFPLSGASWSDTFGPYQARIYIVNGAGGTPPPLPPPPPPGLSLTFTNPASGATVSGTATVTMSASGGTGYNFSVAVDGTNVYTGTNPSFSWNTTATANGTRTLTATVTDSQSRTATATRSVTVSNTAPTSFTVAFSYPASGATVSGSQTVGLTTTAPWGQAKTFTLSVDGVVLTSQSVTGTTLWYTWTTTQTANGARTLTATVTLNGVTATATLPVTVSNASSPPPPPPPPLTASFMAPTTGTVVSGTTMVSMAASGATGASTFRLTVDGATVSTQTVSGATATYPWNTAASPAGTRLLQLTVTDSAARTATTTVAVTVGKSTPRDFDGDGRADILWRETGGAVHLWRLNANLTLGTSSPVGSVGNEWAIQGVGDFNGDGKADILWRNTSGVAFMWLMNGSTIIHAVSPGSVGTDWSIHGVGDFNGDGKADVLWRNTSGQIFMWFMNGATIVGSGPVSTVGTDWTVRGVADFNGDGKADILWRQTSGAVFAWLMNGTTVINAGSVGTRGNDWVIQGLGDLDGDGKTDVVWRHTGGAVDVWTMNGIVATAGSVGGVGLDWRIQKVSDFNGDGKADILWRQTSGAVVVWLMSGTTIINVGAPGTAASSWAVQ